MAENSLITQRQLQSDLENFYNTKVYPYLNGSANLGFTPIGTVISVMSNEAPDNYLVCDGTAYNISEYSDLANFFEDQFGSKNYFGGNGTTTFAVPDLRGEFLRGTGTNSHTNQGNGANVGVHQDSTEHKVMEISSSMKRVQMKNASDWASNYSKADSTITPSSTNATFVDGSLAQTTVVANNLDRFTSRPTNTSVLYCIAYKNIYFQQMHDYSTDEHVVGTWIDGKPVYEKTIFCGALPDSSQKNVDHNITNLDRIVSINAIGKNPISLGQVPLPYAQPHESGDVFDSIFFTSSQIVLISSTNRSAVAETYVTLRYTKTTD